MHEESENLYTAVAEKNIEELKYILQSIRKIDYSEVIDAIICNTNIHFEGIFILLLHFSENALYDELYRILKGITTVYPLTNENFVSIYKILLNCKQNFTKQDDFFYFMDILINLATKFFNLNFLLECFQCLQLTSDFLSKTKSFPNKNIALIYHSLLCCIFIKGSSFNLFLNSLHKVILLSEEKKENPFLSNFIKKAFLISKLKKEKTENYKFMLTVLTNEELELFFNNWDGKIDFNYEIMNYYNLQWDDVLLNKENEVFLRMNDLKKDTLENESISFTKKLFLIKDFYKLEKKVKIVEKEKIKKTEEKGKQKQKTIKKKEIVKSKDLFTKKFNLFRLFIKEELKEKEDLFYEIRNENYTEEFLKYQQEEEEKKAFFSGLNTKVNELIKAFEEKLDVNRKIKEERIKEDKWINESTEYRIPMDNERPINASFVIKREESTWRKETNESSVYVIPDAIKKLSINEPKKHSSMFNSKKDESKDSWRK